MRVLRWSLPVDDEPHELSLSGPVVHVDCRVPDALEVWTEETQYPVVARTFRVFGTGQPVPDGWAHVGTALSPALPPFARRGDLVWHLFETTS